MFAALSARANQALVMVDATGEPPMSGSMLAAYDPSDVARD